MKTILLFLLFASVAFGQVQPKKYSIYWDSTKIPPYRLLIGRNSLVVDTLPVGPEGFVLRSHGLALPTWDTVSGTGTGTVTSVTLTAPSEITVTGSPITGSGTIGLTWANETTNKVFAAPNGSTGTPSFRLLVAADIPALPYLDSISIGDSVRNSHNYEPLDIDGSHHLHQISLTGTTNKILVSNGIGSGATFQDGGTQFLLHAPNVSYPNLVAPVTTGIVPMILRAATLSDTNILEARNSQNNPVVVIDSSGAIGLFDGLTIQWGDTNSFLNSQGPTLPPRWRNIDSIGVIGDSLDLLAGTGHPGVHSIAAPAQNGMVLCLSNGHYPFWSETPPLGEGGHNTGILQFNGSHAGTLQLSIPDSVISHTLLLPFKQGSPNTVLTNDGSGNLSWAAGSGGSGGLRYWIDSLSTASPNDVIPAIALLVVSDSISADAIIQPKDSGALLAQIPDGTNAGGDKRGAYAVDFQRNRTATENVATGIYSGILSGTDNKSYGIATVVSGGFYNYAEGDYSAIPGGRNLELVANGNFGFMADPDGSHHMTLNYANIATFANVDLWLVNNDNKARSLVFYAPENSAGSFDSSATKYTAFHAGAQTTSVNYRLPLADATVSGQALVSDAAGNLSWASGSGIGGGTVYPNQFSTTCINCSIFNKHIPANSGVITSGSGALSGTYHAWEGSVVPYDATISDLYIDCESNSDGTDEWDVYLNGTITSLLVVVANGTKAGTDLSDTVTVSAGDHISIQYTGGINSNNWTATMKVTPR